MKLLIIRHGEPDYEHDTLTPQGETEARLLAEALRDVPMDAVYVSPLPRAQLTAQPTLEAKGITAETLDWLREFDANVRRPHTARVMVAWDWLPQDWTPIDGFYHPDDWLHTGAMENTDMAEKYQAVCAGLDALLERHGYRREGRLYRAVRSNSDTVVLFCHLGLECVLLSHLLHIPPMPLWHGLCPLPSSVTRIVTEERREGIASFRVLEFGSLYHLYRNGVTPSFAARFRECWANADERMD